MKQTHSGIWVPDHLKPARKFVNVVFYYCKKTDHVSVGASDSLPLPKILSDRGYEKIVCRTAKEVDTWSQKMRDQERRMEEMSDEQRDAFEGPLRSMLRGQLVTQMLNARNDINREFCRQAIARIDAEEEERKKNRRISYMHAEAHEDGK